MRIKADIRVDIPERELDVDITSSNSVTAAASAWVSANTNLGSFKGVVVRVETFKLVPEKTYYVLAGSSMGGGFFYTRDEDKGKPTLFETYNDACVELVRMRIAHMNRFLEGAIDYSDTLTGGCEYEPEPCTIKLDGSIATKKMVIWIPGN